jgi:hypothetical protein
MWKIALWFFAFLDVGEIIIPKAQASPWPNSMPSRFNWPEQSRSVIRNVPNPQLGDVLQLGKFYTWEYEKNIYSVHIQLVPRMDFPRSPWGDMDKVYWNPPPNITAKFMELTLWERSGIHRARTLSLRRSWTTLPLRRSWIPEDPRSS